MSRPWMTALCLTVATLLLFPPAQADPARAGDSVGAAGLQSSRVRASRRGDDLRLRFPFHNATGREIAVRYHVALFDLDGKRITRERGTDRLADGSSELVVRLDADLDEAPESEVNYVVSWKLEAGDETFRGKRSLFYLLPRPALNVTLPEKFLAGAPARIPMVFTHALTGRPYARQPVRVTAARKDGWKVQRDVTTDGNGAALVELPPMKKGSIRLAATGRAYGATPLKVEVEADVVEETRIHLSTDKPLYQPGQDIHIRALVLARPDNRPAASQDSLIEVSDAKGNKVFKAAGKTNRFGVVDAKFTLASQVNLGSYNILVTAGDNRTEKTVTVDRYVLPKFKVDVDLDKPFYQPSQTMEGTVNARYFFGKPVSRGKVKVTVFDYQAQWVADREIEGTANEEGLFHFSYKLPARLVGQPVEGGNALLLVETEVEDTGGQTHKVARQVTVASSPAVLALFPESGALVPGIQNEFFLAVADPGGAPLSGTAEVTFRSGSDHRTLSIAVGDDGLARVPFTPAPTGGTVTADVAVHTEAGATAKQQFTFQANAGEAQVLLRPRAALLKVGEPLVVDVVTAGAVSDLYLDVTRDNQTVAIATVPLNNGRGRYTLDIDAGMAGTLALSGYVLSQRGEFTRDSRVVFVQAASDLSVGVALDKAQYKPGGQATINFSVAGPDGPTQAALGVHIVDEALFALSDARPGLLKLFFALEEELLKPSYQIGRLFGQTLGSLILHAAARPEEAGKVQQTAAATIAAQGDVELHRQVHSTWPATRAAVQGRIQAHADSLTQEIVRTLRSELGCRNYSQFQGDTRKALKHFRRDAWGRSYRLEAGPSQVILASAGPDRSFETWDDFSVQVQPWQICPQPKPTRAMRRGDWANDIPMAAAEGFDDFGGAGPGGGGMKMVETREAEERTKTETTTADKDQTGGESAVRVRKWFPETLFVENCLVTDAKGRASLDVPLADSITTWRMTTTASDARGNLGGTTTPLTVFQDFFIDIDFPVFLTRNDRVEFPVVVYNYLDTTQKVDLRVEGGDWFTLLGKQAFSLELEPGQVASVRFPVHVTRVGWHALTVFGNGSAGFADAVQRKVQVRPDGREVVASHSGKFRTRDGERDQVSLNLDFPSETVPESQQLVVQVLPGLTTHVVQGMESMLKLPGG